MGLVLYGAQNKEFIGKNKMNAAGIGLGWVGFKANCPLIGSGPIRVVLSVGFFLKDPSPYLREFPSQNWTKYWNSTRKILTVKTKADTFTNYEV